MRKLFSAFEPLQFVVEMTVPWELLDTLFNDKYTAEKR